jgi:hypothetical protein
MFRATLVAVALISALPAAAQDVGGVRMRDPARLLGQIEANRGCPLSNTSVTVGVNRALSRGSAAQQQLAAAQPSGGSSGCHPLVSTRVVAGVNLALGRGSSADQTIESKGPRGVLATTSYTRGVNIGYGALSSANQRLINQAVR